MRKITLFSSLHQKHIKVIFFTLLVFASLEGILLLVPMRNSDNNNSSKFLIKQSFTKKEYKAEREKWTKLLQEKVAQDVYGQFIKENNKRPFITQHTWAHFFG